MSDSKVSITFKAGPGYADPWIVIYGDTVSEAGSLLAEVRNKGVFAAVKAAAIEFQSQDPEAAAVAAIQSAAPGSQVVSQSQELPDSMKPRCKECGAVGEERKAFSTKQNRNYRGIFCPKDSNHKPIEFAWVD